MRYQPLVLLPVAAAVVMTVNEPALANPRHVEASNRLFQNFMNNPDRRVPDSILRDAQGVVILPNITRGGFFLFGGRGGNGTLMVRNPQTGGWSNPIFVNLAGGSFGPQFGVQSSDVILVVMDRGTIDRLLRDPITLGGDVAVAAGPVGGNVVSPVAGTRPQIYSYSRNRGLFAGVAVTGADLSYARNRTERYYNRQGITPQDVFLGQGIVTPPEVASLQATLNQYTVAAGAPTVGFQQVQVPPPEVTPPEVTPPEVTPPEVTPPAAPAPVRALW